jgi:hypothetical protein
MTLESDLRAAFTERAARVPGSTRLKQLDYHPRTRRLNPPIAIGSLATIAGTTGVVLALSATGATSAFAGWRATPTKPAPGQLALAQMNCNQTGLPLVLSDVRGPFTFQVYANDRSSSVCTTGPNFRSVAASTSSVAVTVPSGQIDASLANSVNRRGDAYAFADGRVGAGVTGVTFNLSDGTTVTATVQNGWYVAWWPGAALAKTATVTTASGTTTQPIHESSPCGTNLCTGGSSGFSSSSGSGPVAGHGARVTGSYSVAP